jgi:EcsC protein family
LARRKSKGFWLIRHSTLRCRQRLQIENAAKRSSSDADPLHLSQKIPLFSVRHAVVYLYSGYISNKFALGSSFLAARFIVDRGALAEGGPVLVRLLAQIASRFGVVVGQKVAAQAVPIVGALGGAVVNYAFIDHFQEIARAHFTVRRLERRYGKDALRMAYEKLSAAAPAVA